MYVSHSGSRNKSSRPGVFLKKSRGKHLGLYFWSTFRSGVHFSTNIQPMFFLQKHTLSDTHLSPPILTHPLSKVSPNIFKSPLNNFFHRVTCILQSVKLNYRPVSDFPQPRHIPMAQKMKFPADWVTFTEEIVNGKLYFLCSVLRYP